MRRVALCLLAHPDDAEILCAGTLVQLAARGWEIHIATATPGDCGSATLPAEQIAAIRRREAAESAALIGASYHCLELRDVNVVFDQESNRRAIDLFRRIAPALVFAHPRHDYMLDHEQTHLLARNASFSYPIPNAAAGPLLPDSRIPWLYYCDPLEGLDPYSGQPVAATTLVDITAEMPRKEAMLACHASQRQWLRSHHGMDEYLEAMRRHAVARGRDAGVPYAEAFVQHRGHAFPHTDLLAQELRSDR
jgi:LmbE family N-acetylglucosaminyl deacetylase